jgi:hypothetical protein
MKKKQKKTKATPSLPFAFFSPFWLYLSIERERQRERERD